MTAQPGAGILRVVATPLGNLKDLSERAREALREADCVAAEDTRRTGLLLAKLGFPKRPLVAIYSQKEEARATALIDRMLGGQTVVLVSDGGTPGISDPGAKLIFAAHRAGVRIEVIPGPSAVAMALSVSSLGGGRFVFEGFLPPTSSKRQARIRELLQDPRPFVLFEAPHRIRECLEDLSAVGGGRRIVTMVREGTKIHEEIREGACDEILAKLGAKPLGEFTLIVAGAETFEDRISVDPLDLLRFATELGLSPESAARRVAETFDVPRSRLLRRSRDDESPKRPRTL